MAQVRRLGSNLLLLVLLATAPRKSPYRAPRIYTHLCIYYHTRPASDPSTYQQNSHAMTHSLPKVSQYGVGARSVRHLIRVHVHPERLSEVTPPGLAAVLGTQGIKVCSIKNLYVQCACSIFRRRHAMQYNTPSAFGTAFCTPLRKSEKPAAFVQ